MGWLMWQGHAKVRVLNQYRGRRWKKVGKEISRGTAEDQMLIGTHDDI